VGTVCLVDLLTELHTEFVGIFTFIEKLHPSGSSPLVIKCLNYILDRNINTFV